MRRHPSPGCFALTAITASLLLGAGTFAMAASFDCAKAGTLVEKTLCGNADLGKLDESVAQTYQPVSYTHLDVYKRQACMWTDAA